MNISPSLSFIRSTSAAQSRASILIAPVITSTALGTVPGAARYDTPPPGTEVGELERSQRSRKETERGAIWRLELCPQLRKLQSSINANMPPIRPTASTTPQAQPSGSSTPSASSASKKKAKATHPLSTTVSGYDREECVSIVSRVLGQDCSGLETQELERILETLQNSQATQLASQEQQTQTQTVVHPPEALNIGGGFHRNAVSDAPELPDLALGPSANARKRRPATQDPDNTNTEPEPKDEDEDDPPIKPSNNLTHSAIPRSSLLPLAPAPLHLSPTASQSAETPNHSASGRPIGLPKSLANASASSRPPHLPSSSARASTDIELRLGPSSISPSPTSAVPIPSGLSSTSQARLIPTTSTLPAANDINSILDYSLGLAHTELSRLSSSTQVTSQERQGLLGTLSDLRQRVVGAIKAGPPPATESTVPPPLTPYPGLATPTFVPPPPDLVEDNEEVLMTLSAAAAGKHIKSKPSLRDYTGNMRQVLTGAIPDFLAYICAEGPYETKHTMLIWALKACRRESGRTLPNIPFNIPALEALKLLVGRAATLRGGGKERSRQLIPRWYCLFHPPANESQREFNKETVRKLTPNSFHSKDLSRPREGQYEHSVVCHAIALSAFYSPDAIGAVFHTYFNPMPLPTVAFALTTIQFCLEEWETGVFKAKELRAERQYNTYCAHLKGLQQYEAAAGSRMARFRREWFEFAIQYSGITIPVQVQTQEITQSEDVRPDTPPGSPDM